MMSAALCLKLRLEIPWAVTVKEKNPATGVRPVTRQRYCLARVRHLLLPLFAP